ncbi:MAG: AAA family ATPase [Thermoplasmata archaeon]
MICITGTPGTGKSTLLEAMKRRGYEAHEFDEVIGECVSGREGDEKIVDARCLSKIRREGLYFGHLSHYASCDIVIVLRAHLKDIEARLRSRGYDKGKIMDNLECEAIDLIGHESHALHPGRTFEILNEDFERTADMMERIMRGEVSSTGIIDLTEEILAWY